MALRIISTRFQPIRALEWVLVAVSMIQGLYVFSPLYRYSLATNGATPFAAALAHPALIYLFIAGIVISALVLAWGIWKENARYRSAGLFAQTLLRFYNVLTTIIVVGILPLTWIYAFTVVLFCTVLWAAERIEVNRNATT